MSGVASDVEGTFSATINWNTVRDRSMVIPAMKTYSVSGLGAVSYKISSLDSFHSDV